MTEPGATAVSGAEAGQRVEVLDTLEARRDFAGLLAESGPAG